MARVMAPTTLSLIVIVIVVVNLPDLSRGAIHRHLGCLSVLGRCRKDTPAGVPEILNICIPLCLEPGLQLSIRKLWGRKRLFEKATIG